ncbi:hypothetical protein [uncultured Tenacibaculum sp.]|uniref:hypothetical protein n=1 Tax=uncultured Tenacibaculum sp. TaxID=174713 RepID=UPI002609E3CA|nr:hypothetical protein [uncultured Tenacibaculum sp.]
MNILKRVAPAIVLLLISPLIAEFLLGDFNIQQLGYLGIFIPLYGASALFIREIVRRTGRNWKTIILLSIVFGLIAEGLINLTLFNPHYAGATLLKYGFIPQLGTSFNYAVFIITLHTIWSMSVPIALAEGIAGKRSKKPWLHTSELIIIGILSLLGLVGTAISTIKRFNFVASVSQYTAVIVIILLLIYIAFKVVKTSTKKTEKTKTISIWLVLITAFVLSSIFQIWFHYAPNHKLNPLLGLFVFIAIDVLTIMIFTTWIRQKKWKTQHIVTAATGAILTYGWFGFQRLIISGHTAMGVPTTTIDIIGQILLLIIILGISYIALKKLQNNKSNK